MFLVDMVSNQTTVTLFGVRESKYDVVLTFRLTFLSHSFRWLTIGVKLWVAVLKQEIFDDLTGVL